MFFRLSYDCLSRFSLLFEQNQKDVIEMLKGGEQMKKIKKRHKISIFLLIPVIIVFFIFILNKVIYKTNVHNGMVTFSEEHSTIAKFISSWYFFNGINEMDLKKIIENNDGNFKISSNGRTLIHRLSDKTNLYITYSTGNQAVRDPKVLFVKVENNIAYIYIDKPREGMAAMIDNWIIDVTISEEVNDVIVISLF